MDRNKVKDILNTKKSNWYKAERIVDLADEEKRFGIKSHVIVLSVISAAVVVGVSMYLHRKK